jgi:hypothetical protein
MFIATSKNALSRKGTRASRPQAIVDLSIRISISPDHIDSKRTYLLARRQSEVCRFLTRLTHS